MVSVLFPHRTNNNPEPRSAGPQSYHDLNFDQFVDDVTAGRAGYNLSPFFFTLLTTTDAVRYRQAVFQDLESSTLFEGIQEFAEGMKAVRRYLDTGERIRDRLQRDRWLLNAAVLYSGLVENLQGTLNDADLESSGLREVRDHLQRYAASTEFGALSSEARTLCTALDDVRYSLTISGSTVRVGLDPGEPKMTERVERVFAKFRQESRESYLVKVPESPHTNHVEAQIVNLVARLFPELFARFETFCDRYRKFLDETVRSFDREIQFYLAYIGYIRPLQHHELPFCYPQVDDSANSVRYCTDGFDLPMAARFVRKGEAVVLNSFEQASTERAIVVTGPNQGGKTTFARMYGQLHVLAALGCPIPGRAARLPLVDAAYTHFGVQERVEEATGKLQEELTRLHAILSGATERSVILLNELFSSTTVHDAVYLGRQILHRIQLSGAVCVYVTFLDALARTTDGAISMVAEVDQEDPAWRTFKVVPKHAEGQAHARALAARHRLRYADIVERVTG